MIYDAAHAFGVTINNNSVLNFGDLSVMSFHATKTYNTFEGGAIFCHDEVTKKRIDNLKNFGFADGVVVIPGVNAKMNEVQAAMGLLQLKYVVKNIKKCGFIVKLYRKKLGGIGGLAFLEDMPGVRHCYTYFPIFIDKEKFGESCEELDEELKKYNIFGRRYFYPALNTLKFLNKTKCKVAEDIARRILCLPFYPELTAKNLQRIIRQIKIGL